jgi:acyl-CoA thioester hydrolase
MGEPFRHRLRVRYHECDPQGVVFNAHYLAYFDIALTELWRDAIGGYASLEDAGLDVVVAEARITYRAPLRFDDEFDVLLWFEELGNTSLRCGLRIDRDRTEIATGELRHVLIELASGEKTPIPDELRRSLERYS